MSNIRYEWSRPTKSTKVYMLTAYDPNGEISYHIGRIELTAVKRKRWKVFVFGSRKIVNIFYLDGLSPKETRDTAKTLIVSQL